MEGGGRKRFRRNGIDSMILLSLLFLKKQMEKPHQYDLKLDTPILGFILQCVVVYAVILVITLATKP